MLIAASVDINGVDSVGRTPLGCVLRLCTVHTVAQARFLLDHSPSIGKPAAQFVVIPGVMVTDFTR